MQQAQSNLRAATTRESVRLTHHPQTRDSLENDRYILPLGNRTQRGQRIAKKRASPIFWFSLSSAFPFEHVDLRRDICAMEASFASLVPGFVRIFRKATFH
jgi:hypothetical protein